MTSSARKILEEALALPEAEREELVAALSDSLSPIELSDEWTAEIQRRIAEIERGEVVPIEWSDVEARIRRRLDGS